jgi:hypothetical protein
MSLPAMFCVYHLETPAFKTINFGVKSLHEMKFARTTCPTMPHSLPIYFSWKAFKIAE